MFSLAPVLGVTAVLLMTELSEGRTIDDLPLQILQGSKTNHFFLMHTLLTQMFRPQYKELTRGPPELVQHSQGEFTSAQENAACPEFDMVWLNLSPIPVGRRGVISSFK
jgi:hypothetical protein